MKTAFFCGLGFACVPPLCRSRHRVELSLRVCSASETRQAVPGPGLAGKTVRSSPNAAQWSHLGFRKTVLLYCSVLMGEKPKREGMRVCVADSFCFQKLTHNIVKQLTAIKINHKKFFF